MRKSSHIWTLLKFEFQKYFTRFNIAMLSALLLLNVTLTAYQYRNMVGEKRRSIEEAKDALIELYKTDREAYDKAYSSHLSEYEKYIDELYYGMSADDPGAMPTFKNKYIDCEGYGDIELFSDVDKIVKAPDTVRGGLISLLRDTASRLRETEGGTYSYRYYANLIERYGPVSEQNFEIGKTSGWNEFFSLKAPALLLAIALVSTLSGTFSWEEKTGFSCTLRTAKNGGAKLAAVKTVFIILTSAAVTVVFTLAPLAVTAMFCGLSSTAQKIQLLNGFSYCQYALTVGQYLLIYIAVRVVFFSATALLSASAAKLFGDEKPAFIALAALTVSGFLIGAIPQSSGLYFLQKFSVTELSGVNILFEKYRGLNIFGYCVDYTAFTITMLFVLFAAFAAGAIFFRPVAPKVYAERASALSHHSQSLLTTEFYKQLISERNIYILLAAIVVKCVVTAVYCSPNTGGAEAQYIKYIGEVSGEVTSEKLRIIDEEGEYINKSLSEYPAAEDDYKNGRITEEEFRRYQNRYNYAVYCRGAFDRLEERKNYLVSMSERYPTVGFIYEAGVEKYLSGPVDIAAVIAVAILGSSVFSCEHKHRFTPTLRIYRRGRRELFFAKLLYVLSLAAGLFAVFSLITAFFIRFYYGVDYLGAHIMSIPRFASTGLDMSIGEYLVLHGAVSFLGHILFFLLAASLSELAQDQIKAIVIIVIIAAVPYYISVSGISGLGLFDYVNMMTPGDIRQGAISYLSCFAAAVVLTVCAYAKWCRERSLRKKK